MGYIEHLGLSGDPFSQAHDAQVYYPSAQHRRAMLRLQHAAASMKGLAVLVGEIGHGKTTLARQLLHALDGEEYHVSMLVMVHAGITATWLLQTLARSFDVAEPAEERLALIAQIRQRLLEIHKEGKKAVVLVDEAQMLNTQSLMEEFRGLLNLEIPGHKLVTFIFFGMPQIEDHLRLDPPLAQRVALRFRLQPFSLQETQAYLKHRFAAVGGSQTLLPDDTLGAIHHVARGVPRRINTLCDNLLLEWALEGGVPNSERVHALAAGLWDEMPRTAPKSLESEASLQPSMLEPDAIAAQIAAESMVADDARCDSEEDPDAYGLWMGREENDDQEDQDAEESEFPTDAESEGDIEASELYGLDPALSAAEPFSEESELLGDRSEEHALPEPSVDDLTVSDAETKPSLEAPKALEPDAVNMGAEAGLEQEEDHSLWDENTSGSQAMMPEAKPTIESKSDASFVEHLDMDASAAENNSSALFEYTPANDSAGGIAPKDIAPKEKEAWAAAPSDALPSYTKSNFNADSDVSGGQVDLNAIDDLLDEIGLI